MKLGLGLGFNKNNPSDLLLQNLFPTNAEWEYDFRNSSSYSGGTTVSSLVDNPASGAAQSAYTLTNSSAASLFSGSVGSSTAKMVMAGDSTNLFYASSNTTFTKNMHKTAGDNFTIYLAGTVSDIDTSGKVMFGTQVNSGGIGVACNWSANNTFRLQQYGDIGEIQVDSSETYTNGKVFFVTLSHDHANDLTRISVNGVFTEIAHNFDNTTTDPTSIMHFFGHEAAAFLPSGFEVYQMGCLYDLFITPSQETILRNRINSSGDGRSYTDAGSVAAFSFTDQTDLTTDTLTTSDIINIRGFVGSKTISVTGGEYRILNDSAGASVYQDWGSVSSTIEQIKYVQVRGTTSSDPSTAVNVVLTVDGTSDTFTITTASSGANRMGAIEPSTIMDLDATIAASADGTTAWANYEDSPADGDSQAAYDFTSSGWVFTGSSGSSAAYWTNSGAAQFDLDTGNTSFLNDLPKGSSDMWFAIVYRPASTSGVQRIFHTGAVTNVPLVGLFANTVNVNFFQRGAASANVDTTADISATTDTVVIVSHDSTNNLTKTWVNTTTGVQVSQTFSATTTNAGAFTIGAESDGGSPLASGTRIYAFSCGNGYLDDTKAANIIAEYESRHGRDYTP